ncbi:putative HTH-type transcriptional regulator YcgK [Flavobacteriaceae bacterium UJ101]|nr:putative HTH-type transcriptional regulator YcgK [Flavobacteriaceae bacterium UJ101]
MQFDFRLKVFYTVAERLSFTRAAEILLISQPAVTKHIKELETHLNVILFKRLGNTIVLTKEGVLLQKYVEKIFKVYHELEEELIDLQKDDSLKVGELKIGASTTLSQYVLPEILADFTQRYPKIKIAVISGNSYEIEQLLINEKIDFGIVESNSNSPQIHYDPYLDDEIVLITNYNSDLIPKKIMTINDLSKHPFVLREIGSGTLDVIQHAVNENGVKIKNLNIELYIGATEGIKSFIESRKNRLAFISKYALLERDYKKIRTIRIENFKIEREFRFIRLMSGKDTALYNLFFDFCHNLKNRTITFSYEI